MKTLSKLAILLFSLLSVNAQANQIDELKNDNDVVELVKKINPDFADNKNGILGIPTVTP